MRYKGIKAKVWEEVKKACRRRSRNCYTCPAKDLEGRNAQAGHYKPVALVGSNNVLSWDTRFIQSQCSHCNGPGQGMSKEYEAHLRRDYGDKTVDWFEATYRKVNPVKDWEKVMQEWREIS